MPESKPLALSRLAEGMEGLSPIKGRELAEAAEVCLDHNGHDPGVRLQVTGYATSSRRLDFEPPSDQARRTHADLQYATEAGACALAIGVAREETGYQVLERARKGTGVDYWLGTTIGVFEARLEVSGILRGTDAEVRRRVAQKREQMRRSGGDGLPSYAAVAEFGTPLLCLERE